MGDQSGTVSIQLLLVSLPSSPQGAKTKGLQTAPGGRSIHDEIVCIERVHKEIVCFRGEAGSRGRDMLSANASPQSVQT